MRLIDADRLSEAIRNNVPTPYEDARCAKEDCLAEIEAAPAIDAVQVTRCKDCAYTREKDEYESVYLCDECVICVHSEDGWRPVWPTHFCSYGCPREEHDAEPKE